MNEFINVLINLWPAYSTFVWPTAFCVFAHLTQALQGRKESGGSSAICESLTVVIESGEYKSPDFWLRESNPSREVRSQVDNHIKRLISRWSRGYLLDYEPRGSGSIPEVRNLEICILQIPSSRVHQTSPVISHFFLSLQQDHALLSAVASFSAQSPTVVCIKLRAWIQGSKEGREGREESGGSSIICESLVLGLQQGV